MRGDAAVGKASGWWARDGGRQGRRIGAKPSPPARVTKGLRLCAQLTQYVPGRPRRVRHRVAMVASTCP